MFLACQKADIELVKMYIRMGVNPNYQHPEFGISPLIESIRLGNNEIARFLLENGADPSLKEDFGPETPLSMAISRGNVEMIAVLTGYLDH